MGMEDDFVNLPPECDQLCQWRSCLHKGHNKGPYTPGRGYTSYYGHPIYCCMTRLVHGCPYPRPAVNVKKMMQDLETKERELKMTNKVAAYIRGLHLIIRELAP